MKIETKFLPIEVKADSESGEIEGYGSVFDNVDDYGDVIAPGAFEKSIQSRKPRMLRDHAPFKVIGVWDEVVEDRRGLKVRGRIVDTPLGRETRTLLAAGALDGLSIGYRTIDAEKSGNGRLLKEVELWEVSVVTFPANEQARVDRVKSAIAALTYDHKRDLEAVVREHGLSRSDAVKAVAGFQDWLRREAGDFKEPSPRDEADPALIAALRRNIAILK
jgi:HK97 family phage prohead protease